MKTLIKKKAVKGEAKKTAQCCAKTSKVVAGCHD
jgi:hypothetical protein